MDVVSPVPSRSLNLAGGVSIAARMETNCDEVRAASPSTFTLSQGRNNRLSLLSGSSLAERTTSPPPSYDGHVSGSLDAHLPLTISNKGWSEIESVSKQFLAENLPGWTASMQESEERGSKQISQLIKAGIKKSRKGLVLRLLRRTQDADEIADLRLGPDTKLAISQREPLAELEATPPSKTVHQVPGIHEAPNEPMVHELPTSAATVPPRVEDTSRDERPDDEVQVSSPTDTLLFGPEEASAWSEPVIDASDSEPSPSSSIVPTPTNGLSVRHATHRTFKRSQPDDKNQAGTSAGARKLLLDVESINRRLLESYEGSDSSEEMRVSHISPVYEQQQTPTEGNVEQSLVVVPGRGLDTDISKASASGQGSAGNDNHSKVDAEPDSSANHHFLAPEAPKALKISTRGLTNRAEDQPSQGTSSPAQVGNYHHMYTRKLGDDGQDTIDGSVTLPTLNVVEPDSPGGSLWLPSTAEIRPPPEKRSPLYSLISHASIALLSQTGCVVAGLYDLYGPEKAVPKDHVRVRWTCTCGKQLHDDFIERRRGAARELEAYLNRPRAHASPNSPSHSANSSFSEPSQIFSNNPSLSASPATTWGSRGDSFSPNHSPTALRSNNPFSVRVGTLPPVRWLLTCADEGQFTAKLSHVDVTETKIRSDKDLAMAVRGQYEHVNRKWWRLLRIRGLTSIDFVQFEVHRNRVVDVRKCPDMPPKQMGYDFEPHDLVPPVGAQYLMHLFLHPEDYDNEFITYARAPKKRNSKLDVGVGWGINLVEGFLADRVWMLVMTFFVLGSSVFAIVWACKKDGDVQGAFGVASWMLTLAVLFVGWAQASIG